MSSFSFAHHRQPTDSPQKQDNYAWFWWGVGGLWLFCLGLRFWGLERFNTLVFDEVYFARYGHNYVIQNRFFDSHPPFGKYMIGLGIWLANGFHPFGYRWMNALIGSLIPLLVVAIAYQLSKRHGFALLAGLLTAADGLLLVESRYALINIHLMFWGLLGQLVFLLALQQLRWRWLGLMIAAICLGLAVAVKWNSLGFILGLYATWLGGNFFYWLLPACRDLLRLQVLLPLQFLRRLNPLYLIGLLPVAYSIYLLAWLPHHFQNSRDGKPSFWELQSQMFNYHKGIEADAHAYCSPWYEWPVMIRPVSYFFQRTANLDQPVPVIGPPLPDRTTKFVYDVHAMGNPFLWWLGTLSIVAMSILLVWYFWRWLGRTDRGSETDLMPVLLNPVSLWLPLFLVGNYGANLLPWARVSRCLFIYHYMPASVYSFIALAWFVYRGLISQYQWQRGIAVTVVFLIFAAFMFWMPIYLGLPLSWESTQLQFQIFGHPFNFSWNAFSLRMWFPKWI
jgi:dolichyl-phosphate-mannose-protein mannosyltransferase